MQAHVSDLTALYCIVLYCIALYCFVSHEMNFGFELRGTCSKIKNVGERREAKHFEVSS